MSAARPRLALPPLLRLVLVLALAVAPSMARADDTQRAKDLFTQGTTLFNLGEFDKAIEAWQEGYKAKPDPGFLYNIGQAYRLKGDAPKAIFFYRGYLRNSPKAPNRADIEAKIAALQKEVNEPKAPVAPASPLPAAPPPLVTPPPVPTAPHPLVPAPRVPPPAPAAPAPVAPPPAAAPPLAGTGPASPPQPEPMSGEVPSPPGENLPWDLGAGIGFDAWTSGVHGKTQPSFAFDLAAGYTLGNDVFGAASFRLGALLGYSFLSEPTSKVSFTSLLIEPSVRVRLSRERLYLVGGLGLGWLGIGNVKAGSSLLVPPPPNMAYTTPSTVGDFELRPEVALQLHLTRALAAFASPALSFSPKPKNFYAAIGRFELLFGLTYFL